MKLQQWRSGSRVLRVACLSTDLPRSSLCSLRERNERNTRNFSASSADRYRSLEPLEDASLDTFRIQYYAPEQPALLPRSMFKYLPALKNWFQSCTPPAGAPGQSTTRLNIEYLQKHAGDAFVPLELTETSPSDPSGDPSSHAHGGTDGLSFRQFHAPLTMFLEWMRMADHSPQSSRLYLAQCQLLDLPPVLRHDFPIPDIVAQAGKGDVYDTNVWIGHPPTYTPLHRDPNPNLFVQLAGHKVVRLLAPTEGQAVFSAVRQRLGKSGGKDAAAFRGEEMMQGQERALLDEMVWGTPVSAGSDGGVGYEAHLEPGDGLFIPKGWWHSIKGVGEGVTASVSAHLHDDSSRYCLTNFWFTGQLVVPLKTSENKIPHYICRIENVSKASCTILRLEVVGWEIVTVVIRAVLETSRLRRQNQPPSHQTSTTSLSSSACSCRALLSAPPFFT